MSVATELDLRELVLDVVASSTAYDVPTIAKEVSRRTQDHLLREAYDQALPLFVQNTISTSRGRKGHHDQPIAVVPAQRGPDSATQPNRSWKRDGIRRYARELRELYATGFGPGTHKPLGKFTVADCRSSSAMRRSLAAGNIRAAVTMEKFEERMVALKVDLIEKLPDTALAEVFGDAR